MKEITDEANLIEGKLLRGCYLAQERVTQMVYKPPRKESVGNRGYCCQQ
jgi:hypothetical protein